MAITSEEVAHLAHLARLELSPEELAGLAGQLDVILAAVARVGEVAAADVRPMTHAVVLTNVARADVVLPSLPAADVLAGAPAAQDGRFRVPRMLGEQP